VNETLTTSSPTRSRAAGIVKIVVAVLALVAMFLMREDLARLLPAFEEWVQSLGIWGPLVFAAGYAIATVAMIPGSALTLIAGGIFGLGTGFGTVFVGASVGATLAFLVSRYVARGWVEHRLEDHEKFAAIDRAVGNQGLKIVALLRLSPLFPFNLLNYALGLTSVRLRDYVLAHLAMLPGTLLYVYSGHAGRAAVNAASGTGPERGALDWAILGFGLLATIVVTTIVTRIAAKALRGITDE